ncbi:D-arabinono-1,4-lactone oxidase [Marisediminicola antarctica]|uniref:FAD-binding protein n=1 Tax=Marisediminicola antarctica TaxID=674079 RepID=A0A7L5AG88_9MICO|nr:D-arabinono-1,4-lactone oxidase [Marisediminicola antarctica]QHO69237.1 FAD-binding protein [Marisediminicola antarctica]
MTSTNWAGNLSYSASDLLEPGSVDELREMVAATPRIRALGSRHSFNRIADTTAVQVSTAGIPLDIEIDETDRTVTVGSGATYGEFARQLDRAGWALHNLASLPHISVAGAIAPGTHGSGDRNGCLSTEVAAIEMVTADGGILTLRRGDPDFDGAVVSLGTLGIVARVTLDIEPTFEVQQDVVENLSWHALTSNLDAIAASAYSVSAFTHWGDDGATQVWLKRRSDGPPPTGDFFGASPAELQRHPLPGVPAGNTTTQLGVPGPWWDRLPHFKLGFTPSNGEELQSEYLVPRRHGVEAIEAVRALAPLIRPHLFVSELRTIAADNLWLSPSYGEDCLGIHFTWKLHVPEVEALLPVIDHALSRFSARPHWGKVFDTDPARIGELYPRLVEFRELADRLDPGGKFRNGFVDRWVFGA